MAKQRPLCITSVERSSKSGDVMARILNRVAGTKATRPINIMDNLQCLSRREEAREQQLINLVSDMCL